MSKYLRVDIDRGIAGQDATEYREIDGDETDDELNDTAAEMFANHCSYGYSVVDESDVPEDEQ